jgi:hypothetical protein
MADPLHASMQEVELLQRDVRTLELTASWVAFFFFFFATCAWLLLGSLVRKMEFLGIATSLEDNEEGAGI